MDVSLGNAATTLDLEPAFEVGAWGTPGVYDAPFIPTQPGAYTFHVTGVVDGEDVDFEMTASPETFSEVLDPAEASFPATEGPSGEDLAAAAEATTQRADEAKTAAVDANDAAASARTVGTAGLVLGALGLLLGGLALAGSRRRRA